MIPFLVRRFLFSKNSDGLLSIISWVAILGVSLGVMSLTIVTSVINGFENEVTSVVTGVNGDIILYSKSGVISHPDELEKKIKSIVPEEMGISRSLMMELMLSGGKSGSGVAGVVVEAVDWKTIGRATRIPEKLKSGRLPLAQDEIILGEDLASRLGIQVGDSVRLIAPFTGEGGNQPKVLTVTVTGLFKIGMYLYDSKYIYSSLPTLQNFLGYPNGITTFKMRFPPRAPLVTLRQRLNQELNYPLRAREWMQLNQNLLYAIQLEKVVISILLLAIVLVSAFNVVSTLMMMVHEKNREISMLKAMGFKPSALFRLFCWIGGSIGFFGVLSGLLGGLLMSGVLHETRLIRLPADIYSIGFLPVTHRWSEILLIGGMALCLCLLATVYPAWRASRRSAVEGLRDE